ncbi:MAG: hypothetical protein EZS28_020572 [Streblomastix strix]|uniref:Uncharacterized protein n=1 Tax=Streblomastix strix TaxID=222440 RepID=A0A5J4VMZ7_9EUKA|nr:MAG: hypothetical protein EZS28_020572 [Streblomastix strix]
MGLDVYTDDGLMFVIWSFSKRLERITLLSRQTAQSPKTLKVQTREHAQISCLEYKLQDVLRMNITTFQKIATRSNRPNDPITRIRKDPKFTIVQPPELLLQKTRISEVIIPEEIKDLNYAGQEMQQLSIRCFDAFVEVKLQAQSLQ